MKDFDAWLEERRRYWLQRDAWWLTRSPDNRLHDFAARETLAKYPQIVWC